MDARNIFANKSIGEMISQGPNVFLCYFMQTNQGPDRLCQVKAIFKQHVNLIIWTWIFEASNSFALRIPMQG